ncbi:MAG: hypothetical protein KatS3mg008_1960 [Acidimicrobiales bacterium]|nr:MAG: hypothetical protein KatS3mg008_1960 [Acidimicrobiales bacterium]
MRPSPFRTLAVCWEEGEGWSELSDAVVAALSEEVSPWLEIPGPGRCLVATRGPARRCGGERALARLVAEVTRRVVGGRSVGVGVAGGPDVAEVAAAVSAARGGEPVVVPEGEDAAFLAPLPVEVLAPADLADLLVRLGVRTLGDLAALDEGDVLGRFGRQGLEVHRAARGVPSRPVVAGEPKKSVCVREELDPPAEHADGVAFAAKRLADRLWEELQRSGSACHLVLVRLETCHGEVHERRWRAEGFFLPGEVVDRVRWQLEGWSKSPADCRPTGGVSLVELVAEGVTASVGKPVGFWEREPESTQRVAAALARVEALLGEGSVSVALRGAGRLPWERWRLVPWSVVGLQGAGALDGGRPAEKKVQAPWPGRLPPPSPVVLWPDGEEVELRDRSGAPVGVDARGCLEGAPAELRTREGRRVGVVAWSAPWLFDERWWDENRRRRCARLQLVTAEGAAYLLRREGGVWKLEGGYG